MSCVLVLLVAIVLLCFPVGGACTPPFIFKGARSQGREPSRLRHDLNQDPLSLLTYFTYISIDIAILHLGEHAMGHWNLLGDGPSHIGPLLGPSESMRGGTLGTNPRHSP
jgi:hypothetical protein